MSPDRDSIGRKAIEAFEVTNRRGIQPARETIGRFAANARIQASRVPISREDLGRTAANALWEVTRFTVRHEIIDPEDHFGDARIHLKDGSLLVIVNHFDRLDTTVIGHVIEQNLTPLDRVAGVASLRYLDPNRSRLISRTIDNVSQARGFSVIPIIQDKQEEIDYYTGNPTATDGKTPRRFNREAMIEAVEVLGEAGNVLMMAPEGMRSPKGKLLKAHEGLDSIMRMSRRTALILPIAIVPPDTRRIVPPYTKVKVVPGELFSLEDVQQEYDAERITLGEKPELSVTDRMMVRLARLLPRKNQGYYRPFIAQT